MMSGSGVNGFGLGLDLELDILFFLQGAGRVNQ